MIPSRTISRRSVLRLAGATASATLLVGCGSSENGGGDGGGGDGGDGGGGGAIEIEPGTRIEFDGQTGGWVGIAPGSIEGETNPTLALQEGETYEMGWTQGDGASHNIAIHDGNGEVVGDLQTEIVTEPENQWL